MKKTITFFMLIISVALVFTACTGTGESTSEPSLSVEATDAPSEESITFIAGGETEYMLVRAEKASKKVTEAVTNLRNTIKDTYGVSIKLTDDFEKPGSDHLPDTLTRSWSATPTARNPRRLSRVSGTPIPSSPLSATAS